MDHNPFNPLELFLRLVSVISSSMTNGGYPTKVYDPTSIELITISFVHLNGDMAVILYIVFRAFIG